MGQHQLPRRQAAVSVQLKKKKHKVLHLAPGSVCPAGQRQPGVAMRQETDQGPVGMPAGRCAFPPFSDDWDLLVKTSLSESSR